MRLISPDDAILVDRRFEQLRSCDLRDIIAYQHDQLGMQRDVGRTFTVRRVIENGVAGTRESRLT
jgi:hypothetical protein